MYLLHNQFLYVIIYVLRNKSKSKSKEILKYISVDLKFEFIRTLTKRQVKEKKTHIRLAP